MRTWIIGFLALITLMIVTALPAMAAEEQVTTQECTLPQVSIPTMDHEFTGSADTIVLEAGGSANIQVIGEVVDPDSPPPFMDETRTMQNGESWTVDLPTDWGQADQFGHDEIHYTVHATNACGYKGYGWDIWKDHVPPPPPPTDDFTAVAIPNCVNNTYSIQIYGPEGVPFTVQGPLQGALGIPPVTIYVTFRIGDQVKTLTLIVPIPAAGSCDKKETSYEKTFPCVAPDGGEAVYAARWVYGDHVMVGSWQDFYGKELTLTNDNSVPSDTFEYRRFPEGITLDEARKLNPETSAVYIGTSTVNSWLAGQEPNSCTPHPEMENSDTTSPCPTCPPAVCLLTPGHFVAVHNQWVGLTADKTPLVFVTKAQAVASGLKDAGSECGLCATWLINKTDQTVFITEGSTAYDIAVAINLAEGSPATHYLNRHMKAALIALQNWRQAAKMSEWYSYTTLAS
ncbi:MAG: hypothetical protein ABI758_02515 [Candidatus Woesebacteria bacterium]